MPRSKNSLILLSILAFLVLFFGGFRLGALVEHRNKTYVPPTSIPSKQPASTAKRGGPSIPKDPKKFTFKACSVSFFLPGEYKLQKESTESATFVAGSEKVTALCSKQRPASTAQQGEPSTTDTWEIKKPGVNLFLSFTNPRKLTEFIARTVVFEITPLQISPTP